MTPDAFTLRRSVANIVARAPVLAATIALSPARPAGAQDASSVACPTAEARQFDFWIGEWDVLNRQSPPTDPRWFTTGSATDRVYAAVDGCAIVEHWRGGAFQGRVLGFSVRAWNAETEVWDLVLLWPSPGRPRFGELHGSFRHGRGDFFATYRTPAGDTVRTRFSFADITPTALRWQDGQSVDGGSTWGSSWIMEFTRRSPGAIGLWNGPTATVERCPADVHRVFDGRLGEWAGRRTTNGDSVDVRVRTIGVLEGCATLEHAFATDGSWESLSIQAYEQGDDRWVRYSISTDRPVLTRWEATGPERSESWSGAAGGRIRLRKLEVGWRELMELSATGSTTKSVGEISVTERLGG